MKVHDYVLILRKHFDERCAKNPNYSLRAYARDVKIYPSDLSKILRNQQILSPKSCVRVAEALMLNDQEYRVFIDSVFASYKEHILDKTGGRASVAPRAGASVASLGDEPSL